MPLSFRGLVLCALFLLAPTAHAQQPPVTGTWRILERLGGTPPVTLEGTFTIDPDTIWVDANWATCLRSTETTRAKLVYECARVVISFDRFDPLRRASYDAPVTVLERVETCEEYQVTSGGQRVCVRWRRDVVEREVRKTGRINPKREAPADGPPAG